MPNTAWVIKANYDSNVGYINCSSVTIDTSLKVKDSTTTAWAMGDYVRVAGSVTVTS